MPNSQETVLKRRMSHEHVTVRKLALIGLAIVAFFSIRAWLPVDAVPDGGSAEAVRNGLAILALAAILWLFEAMPLALTAILVPVMASLTGALDVSGSFSGFSHPLIFLFLGGFGLAAGLSRQGLDGWLANRILLIGRGGFHLTAVCIFAVAAVLSMWISNTAAVALLLPVALGILRHIRDEQGDEIADRTAPFLLLGIAYCASVGGIGTLIGTPPNAIAAANLKISFSQWLKIGMPAVAVLLPCLYVLLRLLARPPEVAHLSFSRERFAFTRPRVATLMIFLAAIVCWLFSKPLSAVFGISNSFDTVIAVSALLLLAAGRLVSWEDIDSTTDWGVLLLFGGGITLSKVLGASGASWFLAHQVQVLTSGWPLILLIGTIVIFVIFLTELSSNTASAALLVPIFAAVAVQLGLPPTKLVLPLTLAASCAFMLPIATPPNAIVFGSGKIKQQQMIRIGLAINLSFAVILTLLGEVLY